MSMPELYAHYSREHTREDPNKKVGYKVFRDSWFVVSGTNGSLGYYIKVKRRGRQTLFFGLEYDENGHVITDANLAAMAKSFCPD